MEFRPRSCGLSRAEHQNLEFVAGLKFSHRLRVSFDDLRLSQISRGKDMLDSPGDDVLLGLVKGASI